MSAYNHAPYVGNAIESVLAQTHGNIEFLITDDGSSDATVEEIKKFRDPRITFVPSSVNRGACAATNELIALSRGRYVCIMNSDDVWCYSEKLKEQIQILQTRPDVGATFGRARYIDCEGMHVKKSMVNNGDIFDKVGFYMPRQAWLEHFFMQGNCLCHPTVMIRKECFDRFGGYRNVLRQLPDLDVWIRLAKHYEINVGKGEYVSFRIIPGQNASSPSLANNIRLRNEFHLIRRSYFEGMNDEDFKKGFSKYFHRPDASDPVSFSIEKALLYLNKNNPYSYSDSIIGLERIQCLLEDPRAKKALLLQYGIDEKWFHKQMSEVETFDQYDKTSLNEYKKMVESMRSSLSWKITSPIRKLKNTLVSRYK